LTRAIKSSSTWQTKQQQFVENKIRSAGGSDGGPPSVVNYRRVENEPLEKEKEMCVPYAHFQVVKRLNDDDDDMMG